MTSPATVSPDTFVVQVGALGHAALARWDLKVQAIEPIKIRENAVFKLLLAGGGRAALRVHRAGYHSDDALRSEFTWIRALSDAGIAVPQVIRSSAGRDFEVVESPVLPGAWQVDVFEWIDGHPLGVENIMMGDLDAVTHPYEAMGAVMARLHEHAVQWRPPPGFGRHAWDEKGLLGDQPFWGRFWELAALTPAERHLMLDARAALSRDLHVFGAGSSRYGLIHADLVPDNVLTDGTTLHVIDFDDAGFGWYLFDIATSLYFLTGGSSFSAARDALIRGYRSVRTLADEDLAYLSMFLAARALTYLGWVHTRPDTEIARTRTPGLIARACRVVGDYLGRR